MVSRYGNLGRLQRQLDVIALAQLGDDDFDVLLARAGEQKFLGLRIAAETQRGIFFENSVNGRADLVFIGARFRLDGESNERLGQPRGRIKNCAVLVAERVGSERVFQFGDGADVSGLQFVDGGGRLSLHHLHVLQALLGAAIVVREMRVVFQHAGHHFEIGDAAREGIGERLEDEDRARLVGSDLAIDSVAFVIGLLVAGENFAGARGTGKYRR